MQPVWTVGGFAGIKSAGALHNKWIVKCALSNTAAANEDKNCEAILYVRASDLACCRWN